VRDFLLRNPELSDHSCVLEVGERDRAIMPRCLTKMALFLPTPDHN
jgi:hypothetical protein